MALKVMMLGFFLAEAVEGVVLEAPSVRDVLGFIEALAFEGFCLVVVELSAVV